MLILYLTYTMYYLPLQVLKNMPRTFSDSNIKYKLIPRLIKTEMVQRSKVGYNKIKGSQNEQKGKALYDTLVLSKKGIDYIEKESLNDNLNLSELQKIRKYYHRQIANRNEQTEERLKRTVQCDFMFDPWFIIRPILSNYNFKLKLKESIYKDLLAPDNFRYFHGIEVKRRNGNLGALRRIKGINDYTREIGSALTASKFLGIIDNENKTYPVYFTGYKNLTMYPKNEESLISKIIVGTGHQCNDAVYVYQSTEKIRNLIERDEKEESWKNVSNIIDILDYQRIFLIPYGRHTPEYEHLKLQMSVSEKDLRPYWQATKCFEYHDYVFAEPFVKEALRNSQDYFISVTDEYNYIIGYLPEVRHLRKVLRYYLENKESKPLTIICDESQVEFYKIIFKKILEMDKLYFTCSTFVKEGEKYE